MGHRILVTGGAGFIGSHLVDALLACGHRVRVLDDLSPQVHGPDRRPPDYLAKDAELVVGDVRDSRLMRDALAGIDVVYHFAARVGVGQSMYAMADYTSVNCLGTAVLLEASVERRVHRLIVASSMSVYGEGLYRDASGRPVESAARTLDQLHRKDWEPRSAHGGPLFPVATPESKAPVLESVYALTKFDQERACLMVGRAHGIETLALRFFNTYGPRQALSNPYTGVLAIFAARLMNGNRPLVFEDGRQLRDFVSVHDVVQACVLALDSKPAVGHVLNIASGTARSVRDVAEQIAAAMGQTSLVPELTGCCRIGDVRHCFADLDAARRLLGFEARVDFGEGLRELARWLRGRVARDRVSEARAELESRGLSV